MFAIERLEYEKVLQSLQTRCGWEYSAKKILLIRPKNRREDIEKTFLELRELLRARENGREVSVEKIHDVSELTRRSLVKGTFLDPSEIALIRDNIVSYIQLKKLFSPFADEAPLITEKFKEVSIPFGLKQRIDKVIDEHGNIRDDASPRYSELNMRMRTIRREIEKILESYFSSQETQKVVQEKHITIKDDRYVIPIKQNYKGRIPGVVHTQSGSGETLFVEPFSITSRNNELRLLHKELEEEKRKILASLTSAIGDHHDQIGLVQEVLADMDILCAKSGWMDDLGCSLPEFSEHRELILEGARHPLIKRGVVPIDFILENEKTGMVITGPNTGGKTVCLKTIGLFVLLAQAGFPVPARRMKTFCFDSVFSDIGDEQSIEQSLSTFSGHIEHIKEIVEEAGEKSLVLLDELGAGTDPVEGGAIGTSILDYLVSRNILTIVTTHFSVIKMYALSSEKVGVASVEFDPETCRPTFRLVLGIPGRSNAFEIARHLGLKREILEKTREYLSKDQKSFDAIFRNLGLMELRMSKKEQELDKQKDKLDDLVDTYESKLRELHEKERHIRKHYKHELSTLLMKYSKELERRIREIRSANASKEAIKNARREKKRVERDFEEFEKRAVIGGTNSVQQKADVAEGDTVLVDTEYGKKVKGRVIEANGEQITVQAGVMRLKVKKERVVSLAPDAHSRNRMWDFESSGKAMAVHECDIRGKHYEEAMEEVEKFIDNAILHNADMVSIIHGLGSGTLRQGVWESLRQNTHVAHYEYAHPDQGGFGCTVVKLKR